MRLSPVLNLSATAAFALITPSFAQAEEGAAPVAATLEFMIGLSNKFHDGKKERDGRLALGIIPGADKMLARVFGIGGEMAFVWAGDEDDKEARLVVSPHLRARMSFPIVDKITFDGLLGIGPSVWTPVDGVSDAKGGATRFGWSLRFAFGGGYQFNETVAAFANVGYYTSTTYGSDHERNVNSIPLNVGLRAAF
ncbi:MAG: hypothetical protein EXR76_01905 [Myxococcales bacterium]|nr:hypothetical protein [Myxococcales bacterium]